MPTSPFSHHMICIERHNTVCFRFVKSKPLRVIESLIVATMSSCVAFSLIYFYDDCRPLGNFNATQTLQVRCLNDLQNNN